MNMHGESEYARFGEVAWNARKRLRIGLACAALTLAGAGLARAAEYDGFTEPYRKVNVASVETGTIKSLEVREGARVEKGQVVARLDDDVYVALVAIADESMRAQGALKSAEAELNMRRERWEKLTVLRNQGHARQEEVERAYADVEIAEARVLSARELMEVKRLEYEKAKIQLARRAIVAPLSGVVSAVRKDEGEFVAPNDPYVAEIVMLDPLLATFSIPSREAAALEPGAAVQVFLDDAARFVAGEVDTVAPVTDAESGTVRVKIRITNLQGQFRCGERCTLQLGELPARPTTQP
ncbi:MAG: efflux RND transporter periplasmic adaptor subunit [Pirellulaceae bacterium]|jgi:RND family efflux transporter MFP subunit|nr:efflux RND transporter periplasmic adaptor subunit [Pirellulaceae bacterium]